MQAIDRVGTYRGQILQHAVGETKNGYPQWVARVKAKEYYDEDHEDGPQWVPWGEYECAMDAYLVLFTEKGPCLNYEQVKKATGWDGRSLAGLDALDLASTIILFRVEESTYNGTTRLQVQWVDHQDASPTRQLRKLDASELAALDAKYKLSGPPKAATAKAAPKPPAAPAAEGGSTNSAPAPAPTSKPASPPAPPKSAKPKPAAKPAAKPAETPPDEGGATPKADPTAAECTMTEAWAAVVEYTPEATDNDRSEAWLNAVNEVAGEGTADNDVTNAQWAQVREKAIEALPHIPF